ncbi:MAG: tRNA-dependent cyclodipeptide synthase [Candidatus Paceibacterota bacterium]|jgi:tRNA-dependent cyclodipeptide synthase
MELYKIRGGSKAELQARKYNIGVAISLGNKWFSVENTAELVRWALQYSRESVVVYAADTIHAINLEVRNRIPYDKAVRSATGKGREILSKVEEYIKINFRPDEAEKVFYATWKDLDDSTYKRKVNYLYGLFESSVAFAEALKAIVRNQIAKEERKFSEEDVSKFATYILEELPECISRVPVRGIPCDAYAYPFDGELAQFVERIQQGEEFPEIKANILDTKPKVFFEVR